MIKTEVDLFILNNCPSFYKINLYNELAKHCRLHVVFLALTNQVVITDDYKEQIKFPYTVIEEIQIEQRHKFRCFWKLYLLCKNFSYNKIIFGGYSYAEFIFLSFLLPKYRNALQCESSIRESNILGIMKLIKKIIFSRYSIVLPSGKLHLDIFKKMKFKGKCVVTKGVGLFNRVQNRECLNNFSTELKYIYVGRLITLKNLIVLINEFNKNGKYLSIVGNGIQEEELKNISKSNIHFYGFVPNDKLGQLYKNHDVFILPSLSETWGLVVEEAIYWGLPVIVSNAVGSQIEMVKEPETGVVFDLDKDNSLHDAIEKMELDYSFYKKKVLNFDFDKRDKEQVGAYLKIIKK